MEVWRDVLQPPIDSDTLRQPRQRGTQQGVPVDVDLFAASKTPFEILGKNTGGTEPPDQLPARFRTRVEATLIYQDGGCDIAETPSNAETTVSVGQGLRAVCQLAAGIVLRSRDPTANRPLFNAVAILSTSIWCTHKRISCSETAIPASIASNPADRTKLRRGISDGQLGSDKQRRTVSTATPNFLATARIPTSGHAIGVRATSFERWPATDPPAPTAVVVTVR
jgi:hypothetical protein